MKYYITSLLLCALLSQATGQLRIPAASPKTSIQQDVGLTKITINHSRPGMKGRTLLGANGLIIDGEKWRMGANAVTTIEISDDIYIQDKQLNKGKYALLSTPQEDQWITHFYKFESTNWNRYRTLEPVLEVTSSIVRTNATVENLMIYFDKITLADSDLIIWWGNHKITLAIETKVHDSVLANIDKTIAGPSSFDYFQAALYLHETQTQLDKALVYIQKATKSDNALFFQVYREALILEDLGRSEEAKQSAMKSKTMSQQAGNDDFVRLNEQLISRLR